MCSEDVTALKCLRLQLTTASPAGWGIESGANDAEDCPRVSTCYVTQLEIDYGQFRANRRYL